MIAAPAGGHRLRNEAVDCYARRRAGAYRTCRRRCRRCVSCLPGLRGSAPLTATRRMARPRAPGARAAAPGWQQTLRPALDRCPSCTSTDSYSLPRVDPHRTLLKARQLERRLASVESMLAVVRGRSLRKIGKSHYPAICLFYVASTVARAQPECSPSARTPPCNRE